MNDTLVETKSRKIEDLHDVAVEWANQKEDFSVDTSGIRYDDDTSAMIFPGGLFGDVALPMNAHALWQVCDKLGPPPYSYLRNCPPDLAATNLNHWQRENHRDREWLVRSFSGEARAVLSSGYKPIDNDHVLGIVRDILAKEGLSYKLIRPYLTPDRLHLKVSVADQSGGHYAIGFYVGNGEVGNAALKCRPFIQRHSCTNSIIFDEGFSQSHVGSGLTVASLRVMLKAGIGTAIAVSAQSLEEVILAEEDEIPNLTAVIDNIATVNRYNNDTKSAIAIGTEGKMTRMGLVNGLSFAAHKVEGLDQEDRIALEFFAGTVLKNESVLVKAKS